MSKGATKRGLLGAVATATATGPEWLVSLRQRAAAELARTGLPGKKDEAWRFTPTTEIQKTDFTTTEPSTDDAELRARLDARPGDEGSWLLPIVDGSPRLDLAPELPEGLVVSRISDLLEAEPSALEGLLGAIAPTGSFAGVNAALFEEGVVIRSKMGVAISQPVELVHLASAGDVPTVSYPRVLVIAEPTSELRLVETFLGREGGQSLNNGVTELHVLDGAIVDHVRVHQDPGFLVAHVAVRQGRLSRYTSHIITLGGALMRFDLHVRLEGEGADCILDGAYHVAGKDHVDHHTLVEHNVPRTNSSQTYHGVLDERGRAVFDGIVKVSRDAPGCEAHQVNRNLLLSEGAVVHTKPHLEIDTDEIVASHGATVGALDPDQLFYLRARAVPESTARAMLTYAFVRAIVDRLPEEGIRERLADALLDRLPEGDGLRGST